MAASLNISTHTVHTHMERLHRKLRADHQVTLVLRVLAEFMKLAGAPGSRVHPICALRTSRRCPFRR